MLDFTYPSFLSHVAIKVYDVHHALTSFPYAEHVTLYKSPNDMHEHFDLLFAPTVPEYLEDEIQTSTDKLFKTVKADVDKMREFVTIEKNVDVSNDDSVSTATIKQLCFPNIALFKNLTRKDLRCMLAFALGINTSSISLTTKFPTYGVKLMDSDALSGMTNEPTQNVVPTKFDGETLLRVAEKRDSQNMNAVYDMFSVGDAHFECFVENNQPSLREEELFYAQYYDIAKRVVQIHRNMTELDKHSLKPHIHITSMKYTVSYTDRIDAHSDVNINKLFNMHHPGDTYAKIYINSKDLDNYNMAARDMQYVKTTDDATASFKGVTPLYNTCSLYMGHPIDKNVTLNRIDVMKNDVIDIVFVNTNSELSYNKLRRIITGWMSDNLRKVLKNIRVDECIYTLDFNVDKYIITPGTFTANISIPGGSIADLDSLQSLKNSDILRDKFRTKTSVAFNTYSFSTITHAYQTLYHTMIHDVITDTIAYHDMFPTFHIGMPSPGMTNITFSDLSSLSELVFITSYVLGSFKTLGDVEIHSEVGSVESIRKKTKLLGKGLLNILKEQDPTLFGERIVKGKKRQYSGLCQKREQRVVPISVDEYNVIVNKFPTSVANLRNQTYRDRRLYLFCPFEECPFLNYHHFTGQMCIPRCTTKSSNKSQYEHCTMTLEAENAAVIQNRYENQTITLYNPLISKGRKCRLPDELKLMFPEYILQKMNLTTNIVRHCLNLFDKYPFIIKRDPKRHCYTVMGDYTENVDYMLIVQAEINDDYFIMLHEFTNKPMVLSEHTEIRKFFATHVKKTNVQFEFFAFLETVLETDLSEHFSLSMKEILRVIHDRYDLTYIVNDQYIEGFIHDGVIRFTPKLMWRFDDDDPETVSMRDAIESVPSKYSFPSASDIDADNVEVLYEDYNDRLVKMVKQYGIKTPVEPFEISAKWGNITRKIFDYAAVINRIVFAKRITDSSVIRSDLQRNRLDDVLKVYAFIYVSSHEKFNLTLMKKQLVDRGILHDKSSFIAFTDNKFKTFVSWRRSKINLSDFDDFFVRNNSMSVNDHIRNMFNNFNEELRMLTTQGERIITKIITS